MESILPEDFFIGPVEAVLAYLTSNYDEAGIQGLMSSGAQSIRSLLQASLSTAPAGREAALAAILDNLDQEIRRGEL